MKKKRIFIYLVMIVLLGGCSNSKVEKETTSSNTKKEPTNTKVEKEKICQDVEKENIEKTYEILQENYVQRQIDIKYPQITGLEDSEKEKKINELIKNDFFEKNINDQVKRVEEMYEMHGIEDEAIFSMDYEITLSTNDMISVLYTGVGGFKTSHHPNHMAYTITIDLNKVEKIPLTCFIDVDDEFIEKLKSSEKIANDMIEDSEGGMTENDLLDVARMKMEGMEEFIKQAHSWGLTTDFAFAVTENSLIVEVPVPHAAGDYALIEIPYNCTKNK